MRDETIDFTAAAEAIGALLGDLAIVQGLTDLHVQGGIATVRIKGACKKADLGDLDGGAVDAAIADIAALTASALGREISSRSPILEQRIPPGYRVTCSHPSITQDGHWGLALRLLATETIPLSRWVEDGFLSDADQARLVAIMAAPKTVLVAGTIGAGKTTLLRSMLAEMPPEQRLVVIEDAAELNLDRSNCLAISTSHAADLSALIAHGFRLDAERIVVGEIRDHAAMQFLTLAAGGTRALTTIHAEPGVGALVRLHQMVLQSRYAVTMEQIEAAVHAVVTVRREIDGRRRVSVWESEHHD